MGSTPFGRAIYRREVAQLGRALGLGPRGRRFESCLPDHEHLTIYYGALAQLGERLPCTQEVSGSIPLGSTIYSNLYYFGGVAQLARAFGSYPKGRGFDSLRRYQNIRTFSSVG